MDDMDEIYLYIISMEVSFVLWENLGYHSWPYFQHLNAKSIISNKNFNNKLTFLTSIFNNLYFNNFDITIFGFHITIHNSSMSTLNLKILNVFSNSMLVVQCSLLAIVHSCAYSQNNQQTKQL